MTRVTGNSISNIDGLIKANGAANLFLINPNGIVFGENARLDIGGSFVGSTADSLIFPDNLEFSAVNPAEKPLLSVNVPLGLQYGMNPGNILVKGDGEGIRESSEIIDTQNGLRVEPDKTLALVGGDINLEGATLKTAGGRIELGSVKEGFVNLVSTEKGFSLNYDAVKDGGNIDLSQKAAVDASGEGAGDIQVWGKNIKLRDGSSIQTSTLGSENGGNLVVNAQDSVEVIGISNTQFRSGLGAFVYQEATGNGGNLIINTQNFLVRDAGIVSTASLGKGNNGKLKIETSKLLVENGGLILSISSIFSNIDINADSVTLNRGSILATTFSPNGNSGNINLDIADLLLMRNTSRISSTAAIQNATGNDGNININIPDGFIVATPNQNNDITANRLQGKGGRIKIDAAGIFGIKPLSRKELERLRSDGLDPSQLQTNDITAISRQSPDLSGSVEIITPEISPENALTQLPTEPIDTKITNTCSTSGYAQSSFTITGKGSLPPSPSEPLTGRVNQTKLATLDEVEETKVERSRIKKKSKRKQIVEAQGWVKNKNGEIFLVANPPQNNNYQTQSNSTNCKFGNG